MDKTQIFSFLLLVLSQKSSCRDNYINNENNHNDDWDYLVYSQRWPITACAEWEEKNKENTCTLPSNRSIWTIHGIWPDKIGTDGPFNCPSAIHFDPAQLDPIIDQLRDRWVNVEANTKPNSFWKHEWDKHGTCASVLPQLNSVFNYFNSGLEWNSQYDISTILTKGGILPNDKGYNVRDINNAIMSVLNKKPVIQCIVDSKSKESLISEIRICLDKSLELIDCDQTNPIHLQTDVLTNCNLDKSVMYYADLPLYFGDMPMYYDFNLNEEYDKKLIVNQLQRHIKFREDLLDLYRFVRFLILFTL